jgi:hypothetical protein
MTIWRHLFHLSNSEQGGDARRIAFLVAIAALALMWGGGAYIGAVLDTFAHVADRIPG